MLVGEKDTKISDSLRAQFLHDDKLVVPWIESQSEGNQFSLAKAQYDALLDAAAQPRHLSGNACLKLCYFLEQCRKSSFASLRETAYSRDVLLGLFNFYLEWNEKNQHRSMRQVVELIAVLLKTHPNMTSAAEIRSEILTSGILVISHRGAQPLVKPALKSLECLLSKNAIHVHDLVSSFRLNLGSGGELGDHEALELLVATVFSWMSLPDVSPSAGKFLVAVFFDTKNGHKLGTEASATAPHSKLWQDWIRKGLSRFPDSLDNIKSYLFPPLFKFDKLGSLAFLEDLSREASVTSLSDESVDSEALLLLAAMEVGKKAGLVVDAGKLYSTLRNPTEKSFTDLTLSDSEMAHVKGQNSVVLPDKQIGVLLCHTSNTVRSTAFSVLISSNASTRAFSEPTLDLLKAHMFVLYADTDAKFRNDVLSNTKHMIERLRDSSKTLLKNVNSSAALAMRKSSHLNTTYADKEADRDNTLRSSIEVHDDFLEWYMQFLAGELVTTAAYQRHITALKAFQIVLVAGIKPTLSDKAENWPFNGTFLRLLLDLMMDPFEDVRTTATAVLKLAPSSIYGNDMVQETGWQPQLLLDFLKRAEEASKRTGRADLADGVARTYEVLSAIAPDHPTKLALVGGLVTELERKISLAQTNLTLAVAQSPVHGQFAALRLIWDSLDFQHLLSSTIDTENSQDLAQWRDLQSRIVHCCSKIWFSVDDVLCNDSPEGHMPTDVEEGDLIDTKDVLSYSFRAIHESSNLLRTLISKIKPLDALNTLLLPAAEFELVGNLTFKQLATLRHRGAFSTVSLTFARCCQLTNIYQPAEPMSSTILLLEWYLGALSCILQQVSTTRRSAGIPALFTGILTANSSIPAFAEVMDALMSLSRKAVVLSEIDETNLPQVHAMNSLKEIFKSAIFGKRADGYISDCLELAADSLQSDIWAIRNCGLILLRSLIDCLFGTSENKLVTEAGWDGRSTRLNYDRYPSLPELLLRLVQKDVSVVPEGQAPVIGAVESVFPALDIIRRAGPPMHLRAQIFAAVSEHLSSKVWHIRDIAARTLCTLLLHPEWLQEVISLIRSCNTAANRRHGVLLALKYVVHRRSVLKLDVNTDHICSLLEALQVIEFSSDCEGGDDVTVLFEVQNEILQVVLSVQREQNAVSEVVLEAIAKSTEPAPFVTGSCRSPVVALLKRAAALNMLYRAAVFNSIEKSVEILSHVLRHDIDTSCAFLEGMSKIWPASEATTEQLRQISRIYCLAISSTNVPQIRSLAMEGLADILDVCSSIGSMTDLRICLPSDEFGTPDLSCAQIRISGHVWYQAQMKLGSNDSDRSSYEKHLEEWGLMLSNAGRDNNDFDTRYSAAQGLRAYYASFDSTQLSRVISLCHLPSLMACYDMLNDDDDEIREIGAEVASRILGRRLISLAAKGPLLEWLAVSLPCEDGFINQNFASEIYFRITAQPLGGPIRTVRDQIVSAVVDNDALFMEEEQNLYVDEVRESLAWNSLIRGEKVSIPEPICKKLCLWGCDGLVSIGEILGKRDGAFGLTSKPNVFAVCMNVVQCMAILRMRWSDRSSLRDSNDEKAELRKKLETWMESLYRIGLDNGLHPLILDMLR